MSALVATGVSKRFGGVLAVDRVDFEARAGEVVGLVGPNGAGKSTFINLVTGLMLIDEGRIEIDGARLPPGSPKAAADHGVVRTFQSTRLVPRLTVLENVMVGCHRWTRTDAVRGLLGTPSARAEERTIVDAAVQALKLVGLEHLADARPPDLPYGHQRLVELARALAARPRVLLLDEPAAGLNGDEIELLADLLKGIRTAECAIVLVEHHMDLVMGVCDQVVVLVDGRLIAAGPPRRVQDDPGVIAAYLGAPNVAD